LRARRQRQRNDDNQDDAWLSVTSYYSFVDDDLLWIAESLTIPDASLVLLEEIGCTLPTANDDDDATDKHHHDKRHLEMITNKKASWILWMP